MLKMNEEEVNSALVVKNMLWRFLERFGAYIVSFIVSLVIARIFAEDRGVYGTIAIVTSITSILNVFVDSGLGVSLVQKKEATENDFSTVFWFNIVVCIILYTLLFFIAPFFAKFFENEILTPVIRVLGITVLISGVKNVLQSFISRKMQFKKFFFATIIGTILSGAAGIYMALSGFGVWALVAQHLINLFVDTLILWIVVKWRPRFTFSIDSLKVLFSFGFKIFLAQILDVVYKELTTFIIGKKYSSIDLADYNRGKQFPDAISTNINTSIDSVLLPAMSKRQTNVGEIKLMTQKSIKISSYIMFPMMTGLAVCSPILINLLLTSAWIDCVPYVQIFCVVFAFYPIHTANLNAIKALGRSDIHVKLAVLKKILGIAVIFSAMWFGVKVLALSAIITSLGSQIINSYPNRKLLGYSYKEQIFDLLPNLILSVVMGGIVYFIAYIPLNNILILIIQVLFGALFYFLMSYILKLSTFNYIISVAKQFFAKRKN